MKSNDTIIKTREELRADFQQAIKGGDVNAFAAAWDALMERVNLDMTDAIEQELNQRGEEADRAVLATRGVRQLTRAETEFYQKLADSARAKDPQQALTNANAVLPETVIERVFEDLRTEHPLLSRINFLPSGAAVKMILNANGYQAAAWGELCDEIVKELTSGFTVVDTNLFKLSAFLPVCKQALILGPEWTDRYVREVLYEAFANGAEAGFVDGDGNNAPIGMTRQVGEGVTVTGGVYPRKAPIAVTSMDLRTVGNLVGLVAVGPGGSARRVRDLIMVVNPVDYYSKAIPATMIQAPDGTYRTALPYPIELIESPAVPIGQAVFGLGYRYAAFAGSPTEGNIDYSDHYRFLEDQRMYIVKGFANGLPMDNNAFLLLDISDLQPLTYRVTMLDAPAAGTDATLSALSLGAAALSPAFAPATVTYTATTTNASNTINAVPAEAGARVDVTLNGAAVANGSALTWNAGENTVVVTVTAEDGTTTKAYTVTVTKS